MLALDPGNSIGELHAGLVVPVKCAEVVAKTQEIGDIQVGLPGDTLKTVIATRPLQECGIHERRFSLPVPGSYQRLVAG